MPRLARRRVVDRLYILRDERFRLPGMAVPEDGISGEEENRQEQYGNTGAAFHERSFENRPL